MNTLHIEALIDTTDPVTAPLITALTDAYLKALDDLVVLLRSKVQPELVC
jgi:hypothetical protein